MKRKLSQLQLDTDALVQSTCIRTYRGVPWETVEAMVAATGFDDEVKSAALLRLKAAQSPTA